MRTIELGVTITDAAIDDEVTVVFCDLLVDGPDQCPQCASIGRYRDTIVRTVTDLPVAGHPLQLRVQVPRYRCENASCEREVFRHNTDRLARPGSSTTRRCARHVVRRLMVDRTSIAAIARELDLSWDTVNAIAVEAATGLLAADPTRLESVRVIGVDEHRWCAYPSGGGRRVCDRDRGPDAGVRRCRAGPTARSGAGTVVGGAHHLSRRAWHLQRLDDHDGLLDTA
ncbi:transposase family protein [Rhodococcus rhodochrous]|uniref:helix-turn-helix domain-containing protein n=1 Tax=Rhodococcus rhodochrous TaxID=1829 RepID=UPI00355757C3|nr:transposase family protein [Rhodococcus rhodochrous]